MKLKSDWQGIVGITGRVSSEYRDFFKFDFINEKHNRIELQKPLLNSFSSYTFNSNSTCTNENVYNYLMESKGSYFINTFRISNEIFNGFNNSYLRHNYDYKLSWLKYYFELNPIEFDGNIKGATDMKKGSDTESYKKAIDIWKKDNILIKIIKNPKNDGSGTILINEHPEFIGYFNDFYKNYLAVKELENNYQIKLKPDVIFSRKKQFNKEMDLGLLTYLIKIDGDKLNHKPLLKSKKDEIISVESFVKSKLKTNKHILINDIGNYINGSEMYKHLNADERKNLILVLNVELNLTGVRWFLKSPKASTFEVLFHLKLFIMTNLKKALNKKPHFAI